MTVKIKSKGGKFEYNISSEEHFLLLTVGIAMMRFQHFENLLITILGTLDEAAKELTLDNIESVFEKFNKTTFGTLNNFMRQKVKGEELHSQLKKLKDFRNYVAHDALKPYGSMGEMEMVALGVAINQMTDLADDVQAVLIKELAEQDVTHISSVYLEFDKDGKILNVEDID